MLAKLGKVLFCSDSVLKRNEIIPIPEFDLSDVLSSVIRHLRCRSYHMKELDLLEVGDEFQPDTTDIGKGKQGNRNFSSLLCCEVELLHMMSTKDWDEAGPNSRFCLVLPMMNFAPFQTFSGKRCANSPGEESGGTQASYVAKVPVIPATRRLFKATLSKLATLL